MKSKKTIFTSIIAIVLGIFLINACKKKDEPAPTTTTPSIVSPTDSTSQTTRATDQTKAENETNQTMDEANSALGDVSTTRQMQPICGLEVDSTTGGPNTIKFHYNGSNCNGKTRTGEIKIELQTVNGVIKKWSETGAKAKLTFDNYKITYTNGKYITFNGYITIVNVNGGKITQLVLPGATIVHDANASLLINFNQPDAVEWNSEIRRTFSNNSGIIKISLEGRSNHGGYSKVAMWGKNTVGDDFTMELPIDYSYYLVDINQIPTTTCLFKPLTGKFIYHGITNEITITYGVDEYGIPTTSCPYGYKIEWVGQSGVVLPYL